MIKIIAKIFLVLTLFPSVCNASDIRILTEEIIVEDRLLGTWQSDKDKTVQWLKKHRKFSEERLNEIVEKLRLGEMVIKITEDTWEITYNGKTNVTGSNIIGVASNTIAVMQLNAVTKEPSINVITLEDENTYSVYSYNFDFKEYFKKIK
jgi:hypothetical protein